MIYTLVVLGFLGLCLGSFVNALVWRVKQQAMSSKPGTKSHSSKKLSINSSQPTASKNLSIFTGRSMCPNCHHDLSEKDLVPVFSWLSLRGRCRYCKKPISVQYPLVETSMALIFVLSYLLWPQDLGVQGQWLLLVSWLATSVGLMALLIYDLKWMLLPNRIIYPTLAVAGAGRLIYIVFYSNDKLHELILLGFAVLVASGIFWAIFHISKGQWVGFGDVRLGLITGTVLATPSLSLLMIFTASLLGTIVSLPGLVSKKRTVMSKIPFGPFLIMATFLVLLFGQSLINWYTNLL